MTNDNITPIHSKGRYFFKGDQRVSSSQPSISIQHFEACRANPAIHLSSSLSRASSTACMARGLLTPSLMTVLTTSSGTLLSSRNWGSTLSSSVSNPSKHPQFMRRALMQVADHIDSSRNHNAAMKLLAEAGIYVLIVRFFLTSNNLPPNPQCSGGLICSSSSAGLTTDRGRTFQLP
jgi:hypothetical protein